MADCGPGFDFPVSFEKPLREATARVPEREGGNSTQFKCPSPARGGCVLGANLSALIQADLARNSATSNGDAKRLLEVTSAAEQSGNGDGDGGGECGVRPV